MEKPGEGDQKQDFQHLIASQMLAWAVLFYTNPSVTWALGMISVSPALKQTISGSSPVHSIPVQKGCRSLLAFSKSRAQRSKTWFKCNSKSTCEMQGQENKQLLAGLGPTEWLVRAEPQAPVSRGATEPLPSPITLQPAYKKKISALRKGLVQQLRFPRDPGGVFNKKKLRTAYLRSNRIAETLKKSYGLCPVPGSNSSEQLSNFPKALLG